MQKIKAYGITLGSRNKVDELFNEIGSKVEKRR